MTQELPTIYLASESPRRKQLLETLGMPFFVIKPQSDEEMPEAAQIEASTMENAYRKALSCKARIPNPNSVIVGADTLVVRKQKVMGKPRDKDEAREMLEDLSGQSHTVITGLALVSSQYGHRKSAARTEVTFRALTKTDIENYLNTHEPYDKAGSYALQGLACLFVAKLEGSYTNTVGLPVELFLRELEALTLTSIYRWFGAP